MTSQEKLNLVTNYFSEDWAIEKAMQLLEDYDKAQQPTQAQAIHGAALAKWGSQPAVTEMLEVTEAECEAAVLELEIEDLHTTPQPTQAQAGVVPLTNEQRNAIYDKHCFLGDNG